MKKINLIRVILVVIVLVVFHMVTGLFLSPWATKSVASLLPKYSKAKITFDKASIWPLTLSVGVRGLKIFDPDNANARIIAVENVDTGLSIIGLLSKRMIISHVTIENADIDIEGASDGTFNVQKIVVAQSRPGIELPPNIEASVQDKDWFGKLKEILKKRFSKSSVTRDKERQVQSKVISKEITVLPVGKRVHFKCFRDTYIVEIKSLDIKDTHVRFLSKEKRTIDLDKVFMHLANIGIDPENGVAIERASISGMVRQSGQKTGKLDFRYLKSMSAGTPRSEFDITVKDIDLNAVGFIYENSFPLQVRKGVLSFSSKSIFLGEALDSRNSIELKDHEFQPKTDVTSDDGFMPLPILCEALNGINPLQLNFVINGTIEKPEFSGLKESLMAIIKPNIKAIGEQFKHEGIKFLNDILKKKRKDQDQ